MIFLQGPPTQRFLLVCLSWLLKCSTRVTVIATTSTLRSQSSLRARYYVIGTTFSTEISSQDANDNSENSNSCKRAGGGKISLRPFEAGLQTDIAVAFSVNYLVSAHQMAVGDYGSSLQIYYDKNADSGNPVEVKMTFQIFLYMRQSC